MKVCLDVTPDLTREEIEERLSLFHLELVSALIKCGYDRLEIMVSHYKRHIITASLYELDEQRKACVFLLDIDSRVEHWLAEFERVKSWTSIYNNERFKIRPLSNDDIESLRSRIKDELE